MADRMLELLQLADSCFPSGGFAFSNGLESLAKLGHIRTMEDFHEYLECYLDQTTSAELPFLNSAFASWEVPPGPVFEETVMEWDAWLALPSQRRTSLSQGQAWLRVMEDCRGEAHGMLGIRAWFASREHPVHFLMVFAATLKCAGINPEDGRTLLLHLALRDQLGAAVRLGLLGSLQAQRTHLKFIGVAEELLAGRRDWDRSRSMRTAPMIELAQAGHSQLYSKLFQS